VVGSEALAQFKVYCDEWTVAFASSAHGQAGKDQAQDFVDTEHSTTDPLRIRLQSSSYVSPDYPWFVMLKRPVLKGHFNSATAAQEFADLVSGVLVEADSEAEDSLVGSWQ